MINDITDMLSLPLAQLLNNDTEEAKRFVTSYWANKGRVQKWIEAYDTWLVGFSAYALQHKELAADVQYLYAFRPYLQFRLLQVAALAKSEKNDFTKPCGERDPIAPLWDIPIGGKELPGGQSAPDGAFLRVTNYEIAVALDDLSENAANPKLTVLYVPARNDADKCFNSPLNMKRIPVPISLTAPSDISPGYFVDHHNLPINLLPGPELLPSNTLPPPKPNGDAPADIASLHLYQTLQGFIGSIYDVKGSYTGGMSLQLDSGNSSYVNNIFESGPNVSVQPHAGSGTVRRPVAGSQIIQTYGFSSFMEIAYNAFTSLRTNVANQPVLQVYDIRQYLALETRVAYDFLCKKENYRLWTTYSSRDLATAIDSRDWEAVEQTREAFMKDVGGATKRTLTSALAWAIIVDASLLNVQLVKDMQSVSESKGCHCVGGDGLHFTDPKEILTPHAHEAFKQYVQCRWPVIVFALDPATDDQNVADVYSRRRELQLAVAVAVANGSTSPSAAGRFMRRQEMDQESIDLNRTAVAFSHGNDTFGWRFAPRVQSPDSPGTLGAFAQTIGGGPSRDHDLRDRKLEPGIRECSAVVIMPSFVPYMTVTSRTNWFCVTNPRKKELTMHDTMRISRTYQAIEATLNQTCDSNRYRPGDVGQMGDVLRQLMLGCHCRA